MTSFPDFLSTFDPDAGKRGKQFEHFVKWFLKNDPEWETQVDEVWLWNDYPGQWGRDKGIDLVFKDKNGKIWAVQAKCYSPNYEITKADVDKFLSESNRKLIDHRLLIATTDGLGANAREVLEAQEKPVVRYLLNHFEDAKVEYPNSIKELSAGKRKPPPDPRPHQIEAVENIISGFQAADRGQVVMACGTGKTFVCLWVKERLKAKRTLVLLPSLGLLSQTLNEWTYAGREKFDALCVCSDQTVNKRDEDESVNLVSALPFPVTNDAGEIAHFLKREGNQVVFSTYQSSPLIALAHKNSEVPHFDLVIADEAHRVAGKNDSSFQTVLDDRLIRSQRRLFATATPRVYKAGLKKAAEEFGVEVVDMNDENRFGKRFHTLTFGEAIKRELLTDYRVLIVGVDDERAKEWIENRLLVATDTGLATDAKSLAAQIGLLKAIKDWNLRRLISFHGRVKRAKEFSEDIIQIAEWLDKSHGLSHLLWADYVSGEMPTIARRQKLKRLKNVGEDEIGLLSNARCLSEGVDVPALDGVSFIDPRRSEIDIIQSVGRAIRLSDNKTMGTIVIPVFIEQSDNAEAALEASEFKPIWDVLEALKSHDERLSDQLDQLRIELGAKRKQSVGSVDLTKIVFDLPTSVDAEFAASLRTFLVTQTTESWMFWYGLLETFVKEAGHSLVPYKYETEDAYRLGHWVSIQRIRKRQDRLNVERINRLDQVGFDWDPISTVWEDSLKTLIEFKREFKHVNVPAKFEEDKQLGAWVAKQREPQRKRQLTPDQFKRLNDLEFDWDPIASDWERNFERLASFKRKNGHADILRSNEDRQLAGWVTNQRQLKRIGKLDQDRVMRLEKLGLVWDPKMSNWERNFQKLIAYREVHGNVNVPSTYSDKQLKNWVVVQRQFLKKGQLTADKIKLLNSIEFGWSPFDERWEQNLLRLRAFKKVNGHTNVPANCEDRKLATFIGEIRSGKKAGKLSADRISVLDKVGFDWDPLGTIWEARYRRLAEFKKTHGHTNVPEAQDQELAGWVYRQRSNKKLSENRKLRLKRLLAP